LIEIIPNTDVDVTESRLQFAVILISRSVSNSSVLYFYLMSCYVQNLIC